MQYLFEGFVTGLANNFFCLVSCAPVLVPYLVSRNRSAGGPLALFLAGRFVAYLVFGLIAGLAGVYLNKYLSPRLFAGLTAALALWLMAYVFHGLRHEFGACPQAVFPRLANAFPLYAGFIFGINLCPPFLVGLSRTIYLGNVAYSVIYFLGFFFGSSLWLVPLMLAGKIAARKEVRIIGQAAALIAGLWYLVTAVIIMAAR